MPLAVLLLAVSYAAGGIGDSGDSRYSTVFLVAHVGLVLAGFAGFTLAAALAGLYLWQERLLKHRSRSILRFRAPSLLRLDELAGRTILVALPVLTLGMAAGFARVRDRSDLDLLIGLTLVTWLVYGAYLALRYRHGWRGRRAAYLVLVGFSARHRPPTRPPGHPLRMSVVLVGTSHRLAPVEVRERVALDRAGSRELASRLAAEGAEVVCLSTCNRTEVYAVHPDPDTAEALAVGALSATPDLYRLRDDAAALHLFRVAAGLDSLVPGEGEILGQVKTSYEDGATGPVLDRLFRQALHAGKKVRAETAIAESPSSVSSAAAALAQQVFGELGDCRVLLIGAGRCQRAGSPEPRLAGGDDRLGGQPHAGAGARARRASPGGSAHSRRSSNVPGRGRHRRFVDERAGLRRHAWPGPAAQGQAAVRDRPRRPS